MLAARGEKGVGAYKGTEFHRVVKNFVSPSCSLPPSNHRGKPHDNFLLAVSHAGLPGDSQSSASLRVQVLQGGDFERGNGTGEDRGITLAMTGPSMVPSLWAACRLSDYQA